MRHTRSYQQTSPATGSDLPPHYLTLWIILCILAGALLPATLRWHRPGAQLAGPTAQPPLADTINPNRATWPSLARLPGIGPGRARAIVHYRRRQINRDSKTASVFRTPEDLQAVPSIGPKTVRAIRTYLHCED